MPATYTEKMKKGERESVSEKEPRHIRTQTTYTRTLGNECARKIKRHFRRRYSISVDQEPESSHTHTHWRVIRMRVSREGGEGVEIKMK